jgi:2-desacetyl-2-hydroxyethyl bacteriochlorophyllide A dehydrogenase
MKDTMRAAVFEEVGVLKIKEVPVPKIERPDQLIVEVELCSICGTDVHIMSVPPGYIAKPGVILGHELVGRVVEAGSGVLKIKAGDRVVTNPNDYCGVCAYCRMNYPNQCENIEAMGIEVNGGFAEYVRVTEKTAYKIKPDLPPEIAAFAEPLACLVNGMQKIRINPAESAVVLGAGPIGLMFVQMAKAAGAYPIIVSEPAEFRRKFAVLSGADFTIDPIKENLAAFVKEKTGIGADFGIDVVGTQVASALELIRKGGTVLCFGVNAKVAPVITQSQITFKEARVQGTWLANATFPKAVSILESGKLNLKELITHTLPLDKLGEGIEILRKGEGVKILIDPRK